MDWLVFFYVWITSIGFVASLILAKKAISDWRYERERVPPMADSRWVAIDLLITALTGVVACSLFFAGGALVELGRERIISRDLASLWPYFITAGVTQVSLLRVFKLYSYRHLHRLQMAMEGA